MKCPKCAVSMNEFKRGEVTVDSCDLCYGLWLDKGELEKIISYKDTNPDQTIEKLKEILGKDAEIIEPGTLTCPKCNETMKKIKFSMPDNVIADKCTNCGGLWFDKGELVSVSDIVDKKKGEAQTAAKNTKVSMLPSLMAVLFVVALFMVLIIGIIKCLNR